MKKSIVIVLGLCFCSLAHAQSFNNVTVLPPIPGISTTTASSPQAVNPQAVNPQAVSPAQIYLPMPQPGAPRNQFPSSSFGIMQEAFGQNQNNPSPQDEGANPNPAYTESSHTGSVAVQQPARDPSRPSKPPLSAVSADGQSYEYGAESVTGLDPQQEALAAWEFDPQQRIRQSGQRIERPDNRGFYYATSSSDRSLLQRWVTQLVSEGVSESKVLFEAKRLSKDEFQRWASKIIWAEEELHPNFLEISNY